MTTEQTPATILTGSLMTGPVYASIVQIYGGQLGRRIELTGPISIGRDDNNDVVLERSSVSRNHARIVAGGGGWYLEDLGSTNGTAVNGELVEKPVLLHHGDQLKLGGSVFKFIEGGNIESLYHEEIYSLTILDGLTGVHNKRAFWEFLEREMARAIRHRRPLSLVMVDVDHFKAINDSRGHVTGDAVLQELSRIFADSVRKDELVARYGGEEFVFVLPETDDVQAEAFAERIRSLVEQHSFGGDQDRFRVTVSLGVASLHEACSQEEFVRAADEQLFRAKRGGRNRVAALIFDG